MLSFAPPCHRHSPIHSIGLIPVLALCLSLPAHAAADCGGDSKLGDASRFRAHEDNFFMLHQMQNNGWTGKDETAIRAQYSFKYSIYGCPPEKVDLAEGIGKFSGERSEVFLSYTGQFDFYMLTRDSGPVINRVSNPGIHWRLPSTFMWSSRAPTTSIVLSLEHRSNGQTFEPTLGTGPEQAQRAYDNGDHRFFDAFSRGSNYLGIQAETQTMLAGRNINLRAKLRTYITQDTQVTWGPNRNDGTTIRDFDRLDMRAGYSAGRFGAWEGSVRVGNKGLSTASWELSWQHLEKEQESLSLPLFVRLHRGPMNTLSNYTQRQDSIGVGLRFTKF